jgi:hypothetical protein
MSNLTTNHFKDAVEEVVKDLEGHDDDFFRERVKMTIAWWIGRAKSIDEASAEIRKSERVAFLKEVCSKYVNREGKPYLTERRAYEALEVYRRFAKQGADDVRTITNRIYEELGNWSKALPAKKEQQDPVEPVCKGCFHCPKEE